MGFWIDWTGWGWKAWVMRTHVSHLSFSQSGHSYQIYSTRISFPEFITRFLGKVCKALPHALYRGKTCQCLYFTVESHGNSEGAEINVCARSRSTVGKHHTTPEVAPWRARHRHHRK